MKGDEHVSTSEPWRLEGTSAFLGSRTITGRLDVARPDLGLQNAELAGEPLPWRLMQVTVGSGDETTAKSDAWQLVDCYVRGDDLVATYREPLGQPFNLQLYWRVVEPTDAARFSLELMASVQTRLWEAYPWIDVRSDLDNATSAKRDEAIIFECASGRAYFEAAYPGDFVLVDHSSCGASWRYGPRFMERGVIRRLRMRSWLLEEPPGEAEMEKLRNDLTAEEPPLTA